MSRYQATNWWRAGRWGESINSWATERGLGSNPVSISFQQAWYVTSWGTACIIRTPLFFNTTGLTETIGTAYLKVYGRGTMAGDQSWCPDSICVVSAPDVHSPPIEADYGYLGTRVISLAPSLYVADFDYHWHYFVFNEAGKAAINKGGITKLAFRHLTDLSGSDPGVDKQFGYYVPHDYGLWVWLVINEALPSGYIWVEGTYLAYTDSNAVKRLTEGTLTGVTGKTAGHHPIDGTYQYYVDANGAVRRIEGTLTGLTGKLPSQISINTAQGGTKYCYIDDDGNERCFEGT